MEQIEKRIVKETFHKFLVPTVLSSITLSVISMTDLIIAGNLIGNGALTAIGVSLPVVILAQILYALFGMGGAIFLSLRMGQGDRKSCSRIFTISLFCALVCSVIIAVLGLVFLNPVTWFLGGTVGNGIAGPEGYVGVLFLGFPLITLSPIMVTFLRNDNEQRYAMICVVSAGLLNIVFSVLFVTVFNLSCAGVALGTVVAEALCCFMAALRLFHKNRMFSLVRFWEQKDESFMTTAVQIGGKGVTLAIIFASQILLTIVINRLLAVYGGDEGIAIYGILKYLINFLFALFDGVSGSMQPMLGIYYGEREEENVRETAHIGMTYMMGFAIVMSILTFFGGQLLLILFNVTDPDMAQNTIGAFRVLSLYWPVVAFTTFFNTFYRCTGRSAVAFLLSLLDNMVCALIAVWVMTGLVGMKGVWWGLLVGGACTALGLTLFCFFTHNNMLLLNKIHFERTNGQFHRVCEAVNDNIPGLLEDVEGYCDEAEIAIKQTYYINLVIEELVVNVVSMAKGDGRNFSYVDIRIAPVKMDNEKHVMLRVRDNLTQFDPTSSNVGDMESFKDDLMGGGETNVSLDGDINELGLAIVKKIAKDYQYRRTIGYNNFMVII